MAHSMSQLSLAQGLIEVAGVAEGPEWPEGPQEVNRVTGTAEAGSPSGVGATRLTHPVAPAA